MKIGNANDPTERQADRIADGIVPTITASVGASSLPSSVMGSADAPSLVHDVLQAPGKPLEDSTRSFMEPRLRQHLSDVRIHADERAARSTQALEAGAYTVGNHIVFGRNQYAPRTDRGKRLLAHELAHVAQQRQAPDSVLRRGPALDRGYTGEQNMAFGLYRAEEGWVFLEGPSGAAGHAANAPGFDGVAYNVHSGELVVLDNKSFARAANVSDASAITRNLDKNLSDIIDRMDAQTVAQLPFRNEALEVLTNARDALRQGKALPQRMRLVITNAGGRSKGITARLRQQGISFQDYYQNRPPVQGQSAYRDPRVAADLPEVEDDAAQGQPRQGPDPAQTEVDAQGQPRQRTRVGPDPAQTEVDAQRQPGQRMRVSPDPAQTEVDAQRQPGQRMRVGPDPAQIEAEADRDMQSLAESDPHTPGRVARNMGLNLAAGGVLWGFQTWFREQVIEDMSKLPPLRRDVRSSKNYFGDPATAQSLRWFDAIGKDLTQLQSSLDRDHMQTIESADDALDEVRKSPAATPQDHQRRLDALNGLPDALDNYQTQLETLANNLDALLELEEQWSKAADDAGKVREFMENPLVAEEMVKYGFSVDDWEALTSNLAGLKNGTDKLFKDAHRLRDELETLMRQVKDKQLEAIRLQNESLEPVFESHLAKLRATREQRFRAPQQPKPADKSIPTGTIGLNPDQRGDMYMLRSQIAKAENAINDHQKEMRKSTDPERKKLEAGAITDLLKLREQYVQKLRRYQPDFGLEKEPEPDPT